MSRQFKVAVVGATGAVGQEMLRVLEERNFPVSELVPVASERSAGKTVTFKGTEHTIVAISPEVFDGVDLALFSAGGGTSLEWAPIAASKGALVVDNSSAWRRDPEVPLVVPEVNLDHAANRPKGIIANPNCSTIQMLVALKPLHDAAVIERINVATYQSVSGAGKKAVDELAEQTVEYGEGKPVTAGKVGDVLAGSLLMRWTPDVASGYQEEEMKMVVETQKIFGDDTIRVSPTAVRVPVESGHSEAVTIETHEPMDAKRARALLEKAPGVVVIDDFAKGLYPKPKDAVGQDPVYVGRIRDDVGNPGGIQMWVVADNLRKGAALNAVQIAEGVLIGPEAFLR